MKIQIIKIIPCLLAGFILSACVGAVNVPSSVAEKKTESEPIVLDPATVLINRCIMDDNASDASCAPAVMENSCITDPFGAACDLTFTDFYETARVNRINFCRKDSTNNLCAGAIENVCDKTPFDADLCFNDNTYYQTHESMCKTDPTAPRCEKTVNRVCSYDPLNAGLCFGDDTYNTARERVCRYRNDGRCATTVSRVCGTDPFNTELCFRDNSYDSMREITCADESNSPRCQTTVSRVCRADSLDMLCAEKATYYFAQYRACERDNTNPKCEPTITRVCSDKPFDGLCYNNNVYEMARINDCIIGENASMPRCTGAFDVNSCVLKPFGASCSRETNARNARESFCREGGNFMNPLCVGAVSHFCGVSVFDGLCGSAYESMRIDDCIIAGNAGETRCTNAFTTGSCVLNPFGANCDSESYLAEARTNRIEFCNDNTGMEISICQVVRDCFLNPFGNFCIHDAFQRELMNRLTFCGIRENKDDDTCAVALSRPNIASYLQSFDTPLLGASTGITGVSQFVRGTAMGLDVGNVGNVSVFHSTLNLATGDGSQELGGDATDGLAFFTRSIRYYAGIFSGTDLGPPRTETSGTAEWSGRFRSGGNLSTNKDFTLTVNFGAGDEAGTISASVNTFLLTGSFDSNGVIRGNVSIKNANSPGTLRGLIGEEGAVGVFIQDTRGGSYYGGFIAQPPAE